MPFLQDIIHKIEEGGGMRYIRLGLIALAISFLFFGYNLRAFKNLNTIEGMDAAQVARNLSKGEGFTTKFVRPFSMHLVETRTVERMKRDPNSGSSTNLALIKGNHPDLANPPAYPVILAALMKVLPFHWEIGGAKPFWNPGGRFARYQPDFIIAMFNQLLFFLLVFMIFRIALRLFDQGVAWVSALLLLFAEIFWRFSCTGLSTLLLCVILTSLVWLLILLEAEAREPKRGGSWPLILGISIGLLLALGTLTRYSFGWLLVPIIVFVALYGGQKAVPAALAVVLVFLAAIAPWMYRNYQLSGAWFGTAGYVLMETTPNIFPEFRLQRTLDPQFEGYLRNATVFFWHKLLVNIKMILQTELPRLGGTWATAFFLVGLLIPFNNPAPRKIRQFVVSSLFVLIIVQALGRTNLSEVTPDLNSENLLILLVPLLVMYGVSLFYALLDRLPLPMIEMRYIVIGLFVAIVSLPMFFVFLPPRPTSVAYPPYDPPAIQQIGSWMRPGELVMSDIPWAIAWYGDCQSVWLTRRVTPDPEDPKMQEHFFSIHDYYKPIHGLYLTPVTVDRRFISEWFKTDEYNWGQFLLQTLVEKQVPRVFPLGHLGDIPYTPLHPQPPEVEKRVAALDQQLAALGKLGNMLLQDTNTGPAILTSAQSQALMQEVMHLAEGREFPLQNAPVRSMKDLEQLILRGQVFLTDRQRW